MIYETLIDTRRGQEENFHKNTHKHTLSLLLRKKNKKKKI